MSEPSSTTIGVIVGLVSFVGSILASGASLSWKARGVVEEADKKVEAKATELRSEFKKAHEDFLKDVSETFIAIRQKIVDVEIWNRDNFVRREDFTAIVTGLNRSIEALGSKIDARLQEMRAERTEDNKAIEDKIDKLDNKLDRLARYKEN